MVCADFAHISKHFEAAYGCKPEVTSIAPGRVNLIGEHVDHQGYAVLPTAIEHTIQVAVAKKAYNGTLLEVRHPDSKFVPLKVDSLANLRIPAQRLWTNYVLAALYGICEYENFNHDLSKVGSPASVVNGLTANDFANKKFAQYSYSVMIDGRVPIAAGVSSSSSLVVACASAFAKILDLKINRLQLAEMCATCENHVGVASGGMDQASICLSRPGGAQLIEFNPLQAQTVFLPENAALVVCNTCKEAAKLETAAIYYNKRVFELKVACYIILKGKFPNEKVTPAMLPTLTLKQVQEKCGVPLKEAYKLVEQYIPNKAVSKRKLLELIGEEGVAALNSSKCGPEVWARNTFFDPYRRALHVYTEAARVYEFVEVCRTEGMEEEAKLRKLGDLLNASDESLTADFDCSAPELYDVIALAVKLGAYGSRLTGAGWGGCAMALVHKSKLATFMEGMKAYFDPKAHPNCKFPQDLSTVLFSVIPGPGATLYNSAGQVIEWE